MKEEGLKNVLYQKLGNEWYAFSETENGEIIYTLLPKDFDPNEQRELIHVIPEGKEQKETKPKRRPSATSSL